MCPKEPPDKRPLSSERILRDGIEERIGGLKKAERSGNLSRILVFAHTGVERACLTV